MNDQQVSQDASSAPESGFNAETYARRFHVMVGSLGPSYGFQFALPDWDQTPEAHRELMRSVVRSVFWPLTVEAVESLQLGVAQIKAWIRMFPEYEGTDDKEVLDRMRRAILLLTDPDMLPGTKEILTAHPT